MDLLPAQTLLSFCVSLLYFILLAFLDLYKLGLFCPITTLTLKINNINNYNKNYVPIWTGSFFCFHNLKGTIGRQSCYFFLQHLFTTTFFYNWIEKLSRFFEGCEIIQKFFVFIQDLFYSLCYIQQNYIQQIDSECHIHLNLISI